MSKKEEQFKVTRVEEVPLNFYAVRSKDGKWLRAKGCGGSGESWVSDIGRAKIYPNTRGPKTQITFWATHYPQFGVPDLVRITVGKCEYLDQEERVKKSAIIKEVKEAERELRYAIMYQEQHAAKVKAYRGDGNDRESIRFRENVKKATDRLEKAKAAKNNAKKETTAPLPGKRKRSTHGLQPTEKKLNSSFYQKLITSH